MSLQTTRMLYRILFSALILLSLLWLSLADWPWVNRSDPVTIRSSPYTSQGVPLAI